MSEQQRLQAAQILGLAVIQSYAKDGDDLVITTRVMFEDTCINTWETRQNYNAVLEQLNIRMDSIADKQSITEQQIADITALAEE